MCVHTECSKPAHLHIQMTTLHSYVRTLLKLQKTTHDCYISIKFNTSNLAQQVLNILHTLL